MKILSRMNAKSNDLSGEGDVTIAFLGDSVTQGCFELYKTSEISFDTIFDTANSYSKKLEQIFQMVYPKVPLTIINAGISGESAENGLKRLERDVLKFHPDLVVVCFGLNDCTHGRNYITSYTNSLKTIFQTLCKENIETIFMTPNMMNTYVDHTETDAYLRRVAESFMQFQNDEILDDFMSAAMKTASECGVKVCDCYGKWKTLSDNGVNVTKLLSNHINHPTRDMHWLFAWSLFNTILED